MSLSVGGDCELLLKKENMAEVMERHCCDYVTLNMSLFCKLSRSPSPTGHEEASCSVEVPVERATQYRITCKLETKLRDSYYTLLY